MFYSMNGCEFKSSGGEKIYTLEKASELALSSIHIESDCMDFVSAIQARHNCWSTLGLLVEDIKFLASQLQSYSALLMCEGMSMLN